jgi:hypothetical protein
VMTEMSPSTFCIFLLLCNRINHILCCVVPSSIHYHRHLIHRLPQSESI